MKTQTAVLLGVGGVVLYLVMKKSSAAVPAGSTPALTYCTGPNTPASTGLCAGQTALGIQPWCAGGCSNAGGGNISYCL